MIIIKSRSDRTWWYFQFQTSKNMSSGEGGAIVSNDESFIDACFLIIIVGGLEMVSGMSISGWEVT